METNSVGQLLFFCLKVCLLLIYVQYANGDLVGHMQPLGNQHPPSVPIDEFTLETAPPPKEFYEKYVKPSRAAIFRNALINTKAFNIWTDEYLKEHYGDLELRLEGKKEKVHATPVGEKYLGRDTIRHFVDTYQMPDSWTYVVSELPRPMYDEVGVLPSLGACGEMNKSFVEIDLWWSGGGSKSVMHKDAFNQINCLHRGTKYWKLFEYKYEKWLYKHPESELEIGGFSDINVEAVDLIKHPDFLKVPWSNFTINAGDCLFLPKSYYHQVDSDGPSNLAVSILFSRYDYREPEDFSDCNENTDYLVPRPLSEFDVMWQWKGKGVMSMGYGDLEESFRIPLIKEAEQGERIDEKFLRELEGLGHSERTPQGNLTEAISLMDSDGDGSLNAEELRKANYSQMKKFAELTENYEPSNNYDFEYSFVTFWNVYYLLKSTLRWQDNITRDGWIKLYKKQCGGTKAYADEVFSKLVQSNSTNSFASKDITEDDVRRSLSNWLRFWVPQYAGDRRDPNDPSSFDDEILQLEPEGDNAVLNEEVEILGSKDEL